MMGRTRRSASTASDQSVPGTSNSQQAQNPQEEVGSAKSTAKGKAKAAKAKVSVAEDPAEISSSEPKESNEVKEDTKLEKEDPINEGGDGAETRPPKNNDGDQEEDTRLYCVCRGHDDGRVSFFL